MGFSPSFLDNLRSRLSLNELVGRHVELRRHGAEFKGLCPFHNEKTPSFTVNEAKGFFHCFGCEAHGDIFGFVMQLEGLSFVEAVERLAEDSGVPLPEWKPADTAARERRDSLLAINELAAQWFENQLRGQKGGAARSYLSKRGLDADTARHFRLGFAPNVGPSLYNYMTEKHVAEPAMLDSGLVRKKDQGRPAYDFFRGRAMFPILDRQGRVLGFGGRTLGTGQPKYINSPESDLFKKGLTLYNISSATTNKGGSQAVVVGEGYMDVIALHRAGFRGAVAPLGTALTNEQIALLWRFSPEPLLCFDGDEAGQKAAYRAAQRTLPLLKPGHSLGFVFLPDGHDPDSLVARDGGRELQTLIANPTPLVDFTWNQLALNHLIDTPERQAALKQTLRQTVRSIADKTVQQGYASEFKKRLNSLLGTSPRSHQNHKNRDTLISSAVLKNHARGKAKRGDPSHRERVLVAILVGHPDLLPDVGEDFANVHLNNQNLRSLGLSLLELWNQNPEIGYENARMELTKNGHGDTLALLFDRIGWNQTITEPSIQPSSDRETALAAWRETLAIHVEETNHSDP